MTDPLMEEIIKELEESRRKLSRLQDGIVPRADGSIRHDGSIRYDGSATYLHVKKEELSPILENLNTVIQDLKNSIERDS